MRGEVDTDGKFDEDDEHAGTVKAGRGKGIQAKGPKMPCFDERVDDMDAFLHRLKFMQIAKDGKKDSGQYICQHF